MEAPKYWLCVQELSNLKKLENRFWQFYATIYFDNSGLHSTFFSSNFGSFKFVTMAPTLGLHSTFFSSNFGSAATCFCLSTRVDFCFCLSTREDVCLGLSIRVFLCFGWFQIGFLCMGHSSRRNLGTQNCQTWKKLENRFWQFYATIYFDNSWTQSQ